MTVTLDLEHASSTRVQLFDPTGREVLAQQAGMLGIGEHDIEAAPSVVDLLDGCLHRRGLGDIGKQRQRLTAETLDFRDGRV